MTYFRVKRPLCELFVASSGLSRIFLYALLLDRHCWLTANFRLKNEFLISCGWKIEGGPHRAGIEQWEKKKNHKRTRALSNNKIIKKYIWNDKWYTSMCFFQFNRNKSGRNLIWNDKPYRMQWIWTQCNLNCFIFVLQRRGNIRQLKSIYLHEIYFWWFSSQLLQKK